MGRSGCHSNNFQVRKIFSQPEWLALAASHSCPRSASRISDTKLAGCEGFKNIFLTLVFNLILLSLSHEDR